MPDHELKKRYWRTNLLYVGALLSIWFTVSFVCSILLVDELDAVQIGGFKLGFWFAQQGSIYVFVLLIFVYVLLMNRLERRLQEQEARESDASDESEADS